MNNESHPGKINRFGGRLVKLRGTIASIAPGLIAASIVVTGSAANAETITDARTSFASALDEDHTVSATGSVSGPAANGETIFNVTPLSYSSTFDNQGTIGITSFSAPSGSATAVSFGAVNGGSILNNGMINLAGSGGSTLNYRGLVTGDVSNGTLTNAGTISINMSGLSDGNATGIQTGDFGGEFTNTGTIAINLSAHSSGTVTGIRTENLSGSLVNDGIIDLDVFAGSSSPYAIGISVDQINAGASLTNNGTIDIKLISDESSATAYGISTGDVAGSLTNNGLIKIDIVTPSDAYGYGISTGSVDGSLLNDGTIDIKLRTETDSITATGINVSDIGANATVENSGSILLDLHSTDYSAEGFGISVSTIEGSLINSGLIDVKSSATSSYATAEGMSAFEVHGTLHNSGTIKVKATAFSYSASATGIDVTRINHGGHLLNSGTIDVQVNASSSSADGKGINVFFHEDGTLENSGTIKVHVADVSSYGTAYGLNGYRLFRGNVLNSGAIDVRVSGQDASSADAFGVRYSEFGTSGPSSFMNSGTITVKNTVRATSADRIYGAYFRRAGESATFQNTGTIDVSGIGQSAGGFYVGQYGGEALQQFDNSGDISVNVEASTTSYSVAASGVGINTRIANGSVTNSGKISLIATGKHGIVSMEGFDISGDITAGSTVENSGTIDVTYNGGRADFRGLSALSLIDSTSSLSNSGAINLNVKNGPSGLGNIDAVGLHLGTLDGTATHSGSIRIAGDQAFAQEYGIYVGQLNGSFDLTGHVTVSGLATTNSYAVYFHDGAGTLNVTTDADIAGTIRVANHDVNLDAVGGNKVYHFEDANIAAGTFTTKVTDPTSAWFTQDEGTAAPIYATVDATTLDSGGLFVADFGGLLNTLGDQVQTSPSATVTRNNLSFGRDSALGELRFFAEASGSVTRQDNLSAKIGIADTTFGALGETNSGIAYAFGLGAFSGTGSSGANSFESTGYYVGATAAKELGNFTVEGGLGYGRLSTEGERAIDGSPAAQSNYESTFATAHLGASRGFTLVNGLQIDGFGHLRYTKQDNGGYTETGALSNATVAARSFEVIESSIGLEVSKSLGENGDAGTLSGLISANMRQVSGDALTSVTLLGSTQDIPTAFSDFSGVTLGITYEKEIIAGATVNFSIDHEVGNNGSSQLQAGLNWQF